MLVGDGAARFAHEHDFETADLLTPPAQAAWRRQMSRFAASTPDHLALGAGYLPHPLLQRGAMSLTEMSRLATDPDKTAGTVNFLALDSDGRIASAVSTSGWAFKFPGRLGDSPVIGAGNYCDDRFGGCACTGLGEWAIRAGVAKSVIAAIEYGIPLEEACRRAMVDLLSIPVPAGIDAAMSLVAIDGLGNHMQGYSTAQS